MKGYRLNEDKDYVFKIIEGTHKKNGHCPCRLTSDDTTLCPCNKFISTSICRCKLFFKIDEK